MHLSSPSFLPHNIFKTSYPNPASKTTSLKFEDDDKLGLHSWVLLCIAPPHHLLHHPPLPPTPVVDPRQFKPRLPGSLWRLLLNPSASGAKPCKDGDGVGVRRFAGRPEGGEAEECRVCLCEVEEGEEITDLRCNHLFHTVCLDAWIGSGHATCPLCRGRVFAPSESEVVQFEFCSLSSSRRGRRDNWWLR